MAPSVQNWGRELNRDGMLYSFLRRLVLQAEAVEKLTGRCPFIFAGNAVRGASLTRGARLLLRVGGSAAGKRNSSRRAWICTSWALTRAVSAVSSSAIACTAAAVGNPTVGHSHEKKAPTMTWL